MLSTYKLSGDLSIVCIRRQSSDIGPLFAVRELDSKFIRNGEKFKKRSISSEQAMRASVRQAILNLNLHIEPASREEISVLKQAGVLGKHAPSCALLRAGDMISLLESFGKEDSANDLRQALNGEGAQLLFTDLPSSPPSVHSPQSSIDEIISKPIIAKKRKPKTVNTQADSNREQITPQRKRRNSTKLRESLDANGENGEKSEEIMNGERANGGISNIIKKRRAPRRKSQDNSLPSSMHSDNLTSHFDSDGSMNNHMYDYETMAVIPSHSSTSFLASLPSPTVSQALPQTTFDANKYAPLPNNQRYSYYPNKQTTPPSSSLFSTSNFLSSNSNLITSLDFKLKTLGGVSIPNTTSTHPSMNNHQFLRNQTPAINTTLSPSMVSPLSSLTAPFTPIITNATSSLMPFATSSSCSYANAATASSSSIILSHSPNAVTPISSSTSSFPCNSSSSSASVSTSSSVPATHCFHSEEKVMNNGDVYHHHKYKQISETKLMDSRRDHSGKLDALLSALDATPTTIQRVISDSNSTPFHHNHHSSNSSFLEGEDAFSFSFTTSSQSSSSSNLIHSAPHITQHLSTTPISLSSSAATISSIPSLSCSSIQSSTVPSLDSSSFDNANEILSPTHAAATLLSTMPFVQRHSTNHSITQSSSSFTIQPSPSPDDIIGKHTNKKSNITKASWEDVLENDHIHLPVKPNINNTPNTETTTSSTSKSTFMSSVTMPNQDNTSHNNVDVRTDSKPMSFMTSLDYYTPTANDGSNPTTAANYLSSTFSTSSSFLLSPHFTLSPSPPPSSILSSSTLSTLSSTVSLPSSESFKLTSSNGFSASNNESNMSDSTVLTSLSSESMLQTAETSARAPASLSKSSLTMSTESMSTSVSSILPDLATSTCSSTSSLNLTLLPNSELIPLNQNKFATLHQYAPGTSTDASLVASQINTINTKNNVIDTHLHELCDVHPVRAGPTAMTSLQFSRDTAMLNVNNTSTHIL